MAAKPVKMVDKTSDFGKWLAKRRFFRVAWFAKGDQQKPDSGEALAELPDEIANDVIAEANQLPVSPEEEKTVAEALKRAICEWKEHPKIAPNSLVVLGHPISSVSRILIDGIEKYASDHKGVKLPVNLLDWVERPPNSKKISTQIKEKLGQPGRDRDDCKAGSDRQEESPDLNLAIIPNLCWCFLRSVEGLEGIDYMQDTLLCDRTQFWVIGSGQVGWDYLNSTLKFDAYCGNAVALPGLTGEELQAWLNPVVEKFDIQFTDAAIHKRLQNPKDLLDTDVSLEHPVEAISEISQEVSTTVQSSIRALKSEVFENEQAEEEDTDVALDYFNRLADISTGVSIVALQLFIKSLRYKVPDQDKVSEEPTVPVDRPGDRSDSPKAKEAENKKSQKEGNRRLVAVIPKLPPLPELDQSDLYLLYSLMLHGDLTLRAMAESLGDAPQIVNNQVQVLRNAGIIEQHGDTIKANPIHYPRLTRELSRNNFIIKIPKS
ncbi:MAG: hypothetical protein WA885_22610 [Phormidesmis sp.]